MSDLQKVSMQLDILIELLATMHPYKPFITFHSGGRGYKIVWNTPDPEWPIARADEPVEEFGPFTGNPNTTTVRMKPAKEAAQ